MANSFAVLLSYIDNLLWLCTKAFYSIIFIFEFNYRLVTALFRGGVQLWRLAIQGIVSFGHGTVVTIEFLGNLPFEIYAFISYLSELSVNWVQHAIRLSLTWFCTQSLWCIQALTTGLLNVVKCLTDSTDYLLESLVLGFAKFIHHSDKLLNGAVKLMGDVKSNTGKAMHNAAVDSVEALLVFTNAVIEFTVAVVTYPINTIRDVVYFLVKFSGDVFNTTVKIVHAGFSSLADVFYDVLHTLDQISSFPLKVFYKAVDIAEELLYEAYKLSTSAVDGFHESFSLVLEFTTKNLSAIIALSLCFALLAAVTIYLNVQHDRNMQTALQNLTRLIASFTQSQARRRARGQQAQQEVEGHIPNDPPDNLQDDLPVDLEPEGQMPALEVQPAEDGNVHHGQGDQAEPRRERRIAGRGTYSLRSRPFTQADEIASGSGGSTEVLVKNLKHRLSAEFDKQLCVICQDAAKNTLFLPCRHLCVCVECAETLIDNPLAIQRQCPLCRSRIGSIVEVYN